MASRKRWFINFVFNVIMMFWCGIIYHNGGSFLFAFLAALNYAAACFTAMLWLRHPDWEKKNANY